MRTQRLLLCFVILIVLPTAVLGYFSYRYIEDASQRQTMQRIHEFENASLALESVVSDMLAGMLKSEDQRDYFEYNSYFFPDEKQKGLNQSFGLNRSGLATPSSPLILSYFMIDEDNRITTPQMESPWQTEVVANAEDTNADQQEQQFKQTSQEETPKQQTLASANEEPINGSTYSQNLQQLDDLTNYQNGVGKGSKKWRENRATPCVVVGNNLNVNDLAQQIQSAENDTVQQGVIQENFRSQQRQQQLNNEYVDVLYSDFEFLMVQELQKAQRLFCLRDVEVSKASIRQGFEINLSTLQERIENYVSNLTMNGMQASFDHGDDTDTVVMQKSIHPHLPASFQLRLLQSDDAAALRGLRQDKVVFLGLMALLVLVVSLGLVMTVRAVNQELRIAAQQKDFLSAVTHELKTPLTGIRLYGEMLYEDMVPNEEKKKEYYSSIVSESERLSRLIGNVLDMANIEKGSKHYQLQRQPLQQSMQAALGICDTLLQKAGVEWHTDCPETLPEIDIDADAMTQVFINLIDNAVKFSREAASKTLRIAMRVEDASLVVTVEDSGPGIPSGLRKELFERFRRGERELTRKTQGVGLGLALVRDILLAHGGSIQIVDSSLGGAGFEIRLPVPKEEKA